MPIKKYVSCKKTYVLKLYAFGMAFFSVLTYMESCPARPFGPAFAKGAVFFAVLFALMSPLFGLFFTRNSLNACKFHLPYRHIKNIRVDDDLQKITITYAYNGALLVKSGKERRYTINAKNYNATVSELLRCFPENVPVERGERTGARK